MTIGFISVDSNAPRVEALPRSDSHIEDVSDEVLASLQGGATRHTDAAPAGIINEGKES
jgi:hypothetical protein